jgi:aryl-alcohol dehydrogenase-like predicted oxidoreductase
MNYRTLGRSSLRVSEIGFGLWTVSTGWWGQFTEGEALDLMRKGFDLGITLFDAADTYGNGKSEELLAKAFENRRDQIVIATKVGYDFYNFAGERKGQREIPQDFSPEFVRFAVEQALKRLRTDRIDVLQLHNVHLDHVNDDRLWDTLAALRKEGKIIEYGAALGPAIGWLYEGLDCIQKRNPAVLQHIYNLLEQFPGQALHAATYGQLPPNATIDQLPEFHHGQMTTEPQLDTKFLIRVTHSSGMLEGQYTENTVFPPEDHRSHRPRSWLINGLKKIKTLEFLTGTESGRSLSQAALLWLLAEKTVASCLPNIYNEEQLREFCQATDKSRFTAEELKRVAELNADNFGVADEHGRYKGTMERELEVSGS